MKILNDKQSEELVLAAIYGFEACINGISRLPMQDKRFAEMLRGKQFRSVNDGGLPCEPLLIEWLRNWDLANVNN